MTIAWILYVFLVGTLLACAAHAVEGVLRYTAIPTRWVWVGALIGMLAFAMAAPHREAIRLPSTGILQENSPTAPSSTITIGVLARGIRWARRTISTSVTATFVAMESRLPASLVLPFGLAWGVVSVGLLSVIFIVNRRMDRARRAWPMALVQGYQVRVAPAVGPAVVGLSKPEIVLPHWLLQRTNDEQRLVVVHEGEHIAARDQLLPIGGWLVAALLPWHPAVWWSLSRLRLALELDCDARVIKRGVQPRHYGMLLVDLAGQCAGHRGGVLALADRPSHLERRLLAMQPSRSRYPFVRAGALSLVASAAVLVACESRLPTTSEIASMDVADAEKTATVFRKLTESKIRYLVDNLVVTEAEAHAMPASKIASVLVLKNTIPGGANEIRIVTNKGAAGASDTTGVHYLSPSTGSAPRSPAAAETSMVYRLPPAGSSKGPIVLVDGVKSSLTDIPAEDIASVEVLKGPAAAKVYSDPAAVNGVIKITTKRAKKAP